MAYDVVIKGGRIYAAECLPIGDVAVKDGRIVETGRIGGEAKRWCKPMDLPYHRALSIFILISTPIVGSAGNVLLLSRCNDGYSETARLPLHPVRTRTRFQELRKSRSDLAAGLAGRRSGVGRHFRSIWTSSAAISASTSPL